MDTMRLIQQIHQALPDASPAEAFRMAMLLCHAVEDLDQLADAATFQRLIQSCSLQLAIHEDQHAAIADDLDALASTEPCQFNVQHLWTLVRAIKVQSQLLNFYLGPEAKSLSNQPVSVHP